jgi:hypothetical protein
MARIKNLFQGKQVFALLFLKNFVKIKLMKKILLVFFATGFIFLPLISLADGIVPCSLAGEGDKPICQFCHLFVLFDNLLDFLLFKIVPAVAVLMIAIGGFMYILAYAGGSEKGPQMISQAKQLFTSVAIGLVIIYSAFLFIGVFFWIIGLSEWTEDIYKSWWQEGFFEIPGCP